jgi:uncharacterized protein
MIPERRVVIPAGAGPALEGVLSVPGGATAGVVVCHPHPCYGGDMDNHVVRVAARACAAGGLATLRFNFRGVGDSQGAWDEGRGEREDVRSAAAWLRAALAPPARVALAGYSFGAAMAAAAAAGDTAAGLALIAPPFAAGWGAWTPLAVDGPVLVVAGRDDDYCPREALARLAAAVPAVRITVIEGADHFFSGGLPSLEAALAEWAARLVGEAL